MQAHPAGWCVMVIFPEELFPELKNKPEEEKAQYLCDKGIGFERWRDKTTVNLSPSVMRYYQSSWKQVETKQEFQTFLKIHYDSLPALEKIGWHIRRSFRKLCESVCGRAKV